MFNFLKNLIKKIIHDALLYHKEDGNLYYGKYKGSFNFWRLFLWNLFHPGRIYNRLVFGQLFALKNKKIKNFKKELSSHSQNNISNNVLSEKFIEFLNTGGVVIENFFSEDQIEKFKEKYKPEIDNVKNVRSLDYNTVNQERLRITNDLIEIWLDNNLMKFISVFMGREVLARNYPYIQYHSAVDKISSKSIYEKKIKKSESTDMWHIDTPFLFNLHVLLEDLTPQDSCMQYLPGSHKFLNMGSSYSDEVVSKTGIEPIKCVGKKGTVYMHQANILHQFRSIPKTNRLQLHFEFTIGGNILLDCNAISKCLSSGYNINELNISKKNIIRGIFPKKISQGYQVSKEKYFPTRIKGI